MRIPWVFQVSPFFQVCANHVRVFLLMWWVMHFLKFRAPQNLRAMGCSLWLVRHCLQRCNRRWMVEQLTVKYRRDVAQRRLSVGKQVEFMAWWPAKHPVENGPAFTDATNNNNYLLRQQSSKTTATNCVVIREIRNMLPQQPILLSCQVWCWAWLTAERRQGDSHGLRAP